jgi:threonine dehydrogenase-like Zn-dependent dehydrogenase
VSEILEERLNMAKKLGADYTFDPSSENLRLRLNELTENNGADAVICATGAPRAIEDGVTAVGSGGKLVLLGETYPPEKVLIDPNTIH